MPVTPSKASAWFAAGPAAVKGPPACPGAATPIPQTTPPRIGGLMFVWKIPEIAPAGRVAAPPAPSDEAAGAPPPKCTGGSVPIAMSRLAFTW
ncbi:MAG TPA: hypothetical protein VIN04_11140 [Myxococcota bacterium]